MKKAFTLVELLVVIGIIAILSGILLVSFGGGTESARNAQCLANMKSLASAVNTYGMSNGWYPPAGSFETMGMDTSRGMSNIRRHYYEKKGWISWNSRRTYASNPQQHAASLSWFTSCYNLDETTSEFALTNGVLWKFLSGNRGAYLCPAHNIACGPNMSPTWTYVMNCYFHWDKSKGRMPMDDGYWWGIEYGKLGKADRRLLFAEIPFTDAIATPSKFTDSASGTRNDCTLQNKSADSDGDGEYIGFNHKSGKKSVFAHVVFADGHVEKLTLPRNGLSVGDARDLTDWLCRGRDVSFDGTRYRELQQD